MGSEVQTSHYFTERDIERDRKRQREMYFQLFLLISPALGMPSKAAEDVNDLKSFINFSTETGGLLNNSEWIKEVFESLENTKQHVLDLEVELTTLPHGNITGLGFEENLFPDYNEAKRYLSEAGEKLRGFAYKTKVEVRDLKSLFGAVDENQDERQDSVLLHIAIKKMTGFMNDTLEKLREANEKYKTAKKTFVNLKNLSTQPKDKVEKMLEKDSNEYQNWVTVVRDAVREENNIPEKAKKLRAEIVAHWAGIIKNAASWYHAKTEDLRAKVRAELGPAKTAQMDAEIDRQIKAQIESKVEADIEAAIERYNAKLEKLKEITESMLESGNNFEETIDNAMNILTEKIEKITLSTESANLVSENKDKYPQEFLAKYQDFRSYFRNGLDDLKKSAENLLAATSPTNPIQKDLKE